MNNELFQMCCYVSYIRHSLEFNKDINFNDNIQYIDSMGTWNDIVFNSSLENEYNKLSDELFKQYKLAILYTINESP